jgi:hypothetical protein
MIKMFDEAGVFMGRHLPVFTSDANRVPLSDYEVKLKGALVDVHSAITHEAWKVRPSFRARFYPLTNHS